MCIRDSCKAQTKFFSMIYKQKVVVLPLFVTFPFSRSQSDVYKRQALKRAFLFSCLTALRKSDIKKLTWEEIQPYGSDGVMYVTTRMQKTKDIVHRCV